MLMRIHLQLFNKEGGTMSASELVRFQQTVASRLKRSHFHNLNFKTFFNLLKVQPTGNTRSIPPLFQNDLPH